MYQTALLLLTGPIRVVVETIGQYLNSANKKVAKCLYIKLEPELCRPFSKSDSVSLGRLSSVVPIVYCKASAICKNIDVRVLLTNVNQSKSGSSSALNFDVVLTNSDDKNYINRYIDLNFDNRCCDIIKLDNISTSASTEKLQCPEPDYDVFRTVCLGGTFDRLHNGHKVLLSEAVLRTTETLVVGVSEGAMLKKKVLWELIEPVENRIAAVTNFLTEMDPSISYEVVPITDPYGPTITKPDIDCIVVTTETRIGGEKVNIERSKKSMTELAMYVVDVVENLGHSSDEEEKLSSSTKRMHLLGTPLKKNQTLFEPGKPYSILLRGHPLSGKSSIANRFQVLGVPVLCCDEILNAILKKDTNLKENLAQKFSVDLPYSDGSFDFDKLTALCLKKKEVKEWLAQTLCIKVKSALKQVFQVYSNQGAHTVLVKDSTLFEGCDLEIEFQEYWAAILPTTESIKNFKEQYGLTGDEATDALKSLQSNEQYIEISNIVFCNRWSTDTTIEQVGRAWSYLKSMQESK